MGNCIICGRKTNQPGSFHFCAMENHILHFCDTHANRGKKLLDMIHEGRVDKNNLEKYINKQEKKHGKEKTMSENYIMLNGKRVDLTDDQLEKLGLKVEKGIFDRQNKNDEYYYISCNGVLESTTETDLLCDYSLYSVANYCIDKALMQQRALHETLSRLLWRFSMQNDGDKIDWYPSSDHCIEKYYVYFNNKDEKFEIMNNEILKTQGTVYFHTKNVAQRAIDEIILPFMKEHPDFVW